MPPIPNPVTAQELEILSTKAIAAKELAYCEYSKFRVGACILTTSGEFIVGANVENVSYPVGTCAERVAFGTAIVAGHRDFKAIAVATDIKPGASPCGMCRQLYVALSISPPSLCVYWTSSHPVSMREFTTPSFPVYMYDGDGKHTVMTMGELLPSSFGPNDLPR
ncbi:Cytidine deaminase [Penicillium riverlandense]|uniref:Cytidine deaminase n=1 Tax=Penicillium riverlandense TaxID=1903569 RepID=UPI002546A10B|nr:Cytidine deaminase [Penicillium riverlandense]KAJ5808951.1 Cytidine deaminase [Penicillium riverlandense]